jgi:hypothetical protein
MSKYRKKPVVVDAVRWTGDNIDEVWGWGGAAGIYGPTELDGLRVCTIDGVLIPVPVGHWIIREPKQDRFYPCDPAVFGVTYELVE